MTLDKWHLCCSVVHFTLFLCPHYLLYWMHCWVTYRGCTWAVYCSILLWYAMLAHSSSWIIIHMASSIVPNPLQGLCVTIWSIKIKQSVEEKKIGYIQQCAISDGIVTELHSGCHEEFCVLKVNFQWLHGIISHKLEQFIWRECFSYI
jgi:hypothetical protein